jgi:hypothetical protein
MPPVAIVVLRVLGYLYCSLNAIVAQLNNCPFGVNTMIELQNMLLQTIPEHFLVKTHLAS